jgi:antitoxin component YwqK of YwqJK toxin-antitoxin module
MGMKKVFFLFTIAAALFACKNEPAKPIEQVEKRFDDGTAKEVSYIDPETKEKVGETEFYPGNKPYRVWKLSGGMKNGESKSFHENGNPYSLNTYSNDTLNGPYKLWHENGKLFMEGQYEMGLRQGLWKIYNEEGKLLQERDFTGLPDSLRAE